MRDQRSIPYRLEISFVAGLKPSDDDALISWATRRLEGLPGVFVQGAVSEQMDDADVVAGSPLAKYLEMRNA